VNIHKSRPAKFLWAVIDKTIADDISLHGASIAFFFIFSTAPLVVLIVSLSGFLFGDVNSARQLTQHISRFISPEIAETIKLYIQRNATFKTGIWATVLAVITLIFGATTVISQLKTTLDVIWKSEPSRFHSVLQYFINRLISLVLILIITLLFATSLVFEAIIDNYSDLIITLWPIYPRIFLQVVSNSISVIFSMVFFAAIFKLLPDASVKWKNVFIGSLITTALFYTGKYLVGLYLASPSIQVTYRVAGSFVVFLIWVYYNTLILLVGAEITSLLPKFKINIPSQ